MTEEIETMQTSFAGVARPADGKDVLAVGRISGFDGDRVPDDHSVEWMRGTQQITVQTPSIEGAAIGDAVVVVSDRFYQAMIAEHAAAESRLDAIRSWVAEHGCPRDTNGDGDCGAPLCPFSCMARRRPRMC